MTQGLKVRDTAGKVLFDSWNDENAFFHAEFSVPLHTTQTTVRSFPELTGKRVYMSAVVRANNAAHNFTSLQYPTLSYVNNVPTVTINANNLANNPPLGYLHVLILTDGTAYTKPVSGTHGAVFPNKKGRFTVTDALDPYVFIGKYTIPGANSGYSTVDVPCKDTPLVFYELDGNVGIYEGIYRVSSDTHRIYFKTSSTVTIRVFGRMSQNFPLGQVGATNGFRMWNRSRTAVLFDSNLKMLALSGYTANNVLNVTRGEKTMAVGFPTAGKSVCAWTMNKRIFTEEVKESTQPGNKEVWRITEQVWSFVARSSGNSILWTERAIYTHTWTAIYDGTGESSWSYTSYSPPTLNINCNFLFIENSRYS
ncbi:hypothetical protein [Acinetobacter schindleri]|uniref:hypothetical protein n=1 Tax=Acinetobacter schindleri TaxID=108981 RepID=UPI0028D70ADF|nr:hypothetical protein [Acinetobacter schindleri]